MMYLVFVHFPMIHRTFILFGFFTLRAMATFSWSTLPELPDAHGFAGAYAGVSQDALIVAGGANFPSGLPWEGGAKVWHDRVFVHRADQSGWKEVARLPKALGYGVSITTPEGVVCIGGSHAAGHEAGVFRLRWDGSNVEIDDLPPLPVALANMAGAVVGGRIHVIGGSTSPEAVAASNRHFCLEGGVWKELAPLPAEGRILPVAGAKDGAFYVISGAALQADATGQPMRTYLRDAWKYEASGQWKRLADLPRAAVAAPSPAIDAGASHLFVLGGDDGTLTTFTPKSAHPGFARDVLGYDIMTDTWTVVETMPQTVFAAVTAPVVTWRGSYWVVSGEVRPAVRTASVTGLNLKPAKSTFGLLNRSVAIVCLAAMIGIGIYFMKR
jgi:N-acetylneuraminic acid mutarotase